MNSYSYRDLILWKETKKLTRDIYAIAYNYLTMSCMHCLPKFVVRWFLLAQISLKVPVVELPETIYIFSIMQRALLLR